MKRVLVLVSLVALVAGMAFAQEAPESKADVFGGYQYLRSQSTNINGWNAALTGNFSKNVGITADFSGNYKNDASIYTYMFGPQVSTAVKNVKPFAHVLFGGARFGLNGANDNSWALAFGGGVDVNVNKFVSVRLGQADYVRTAFLNDGQNNFRYSAGLVFHLGGK